MLIIFGAIIGIIFLMFWQTIFIVLTSYKSNATKSSNSFVGNIWFILLLIINIIIIIFIYVFYKYKSSEKGMNGIDGQPGFNGNSGDPCYIKDNCVNKK